MSPENRSPPVCLGQLISAPYLLLLPCDPVHTRSKEHSPDPLRIEVVDSVIATFMWLTVEFYLDSAL
jgi:hypothetical protein